MAASLAVLAAADKELWISGGLGRSLDPKSPIPLI